MIRDCVDVHTCELRMQTWYSLGVCNGVVFFRPGRDYLIIVVFLFMITGATQESREGVRANYIPSTKDRTLDGKSTESSPDGSDLPLGYALRRFGEVREQGYDVRLFWGW